MAQSTEQLMLAMDTEKGSPISDPPPNYGTEPASEAPPTYDSLYGKVKAAQSESEGVMDFFKQFFIIMMGTIGCTICVGLILAIPIAMVAIGAIHLHNCPRERFIPIYLIVAGVFGILKNLSNMGQRIRNQKNENEEDNAKTNPVDGIVSLFLMAWFIAGNVWVYRTYGHFTTADPNAADYCNHTCYWFAFWTITATYILMGVCCFCLCCIGFFAVCACQKK